MGVSHLEEEGPVDKVESDEEEGEDNPGVSLYITGMEGQEVVCVGGDQVWHCVQQ